MALGYQWDSALVGGADGNFHAIISDTIQAVVVQANDDGRDASWLCDYLESVSPAAIISLLREIQESRKADKECTNLAESVADLVILRFRKLISQAREQIPMEETMQTMFSQQQGFIPTSAAPIKQPAPVVSVVPGDGRDQFEEWMLKKWGRERQEYDFAMGKFLHGEN